MATRRPRSRRFDDADWDTHTFTDTDTDTDTDTERAPAASTGSAHPGEPDDVPEPNWSTYRDAQRGPEPAPGWVVLDPRAIDTDLGVVKTGKEAELSLVRRAVPDEHPDADRGARACLLAAKRYRSAQHRLFHRDAGYLEGRRVRKSREMRAMRTRTGFGKHLVAQQWAAAEFAILDRLWRAGAAVPYPVQLLGTELMMEFVGTPDGVAAPRLAETRPTPDESRDLYEQLVIALSTLAGLGYAHGDLSAYNLLVHDGRLVVIDLPQVVDVIGNPQGFDYLRRDCENICRWFARDPDPLFGTLTSLLH